MNDTVSLLLSGFAGLLLGGFFFSGLWWTVRQSLLAKQPALWLLGSLFLRTIVVLVGIYFASGGHWQNLLCCLLGFTLARVTVIRLTRPTIATQPATDIPTESQRATES
jgi:F1F0 ATPase subunit 2